MSTTVQQQAAIAARGNVLVAAGAGTGKTSTVTERCLDLVLRERCSIEQILMVTFTEAAAAEMRERLRKKLREAADAVTLSLSSPKGGEGWGEEAQLSADQIPSPQPSPRSGGERETNTSPESDSALWLAEQLALLEHAPISTLHSFCLELVRRNFHALGLDPQFSVLDEAQTKPLVHTVLDDLLLGHYESDTTHATAVRELIRRYGRGNDAAIRSLIVKLHHYTQTLAAPAEWFAAQTRLFTEPKATAWRELFAQTIGAWHREWREIIESYAQGSTTVRACAAALNQLAASFSLNDFASHLQTIETIDRGEWDGLKKDFRNPIKAFFENARFLRELAQNDGAALAEDWEWSRGPMLTLLQLAQEFGAAFSQAKRELGGIDFADQEQFALQLLRRPDGTPSAIAQGCRDQFRFVFVDECQDINAAQDAIIRAVSREGAAANRFLVGDVKQSIYRFRLADPRIFQNYQSVWNTVAAGRPLQTQILTPHISLSSPKGGEGRGEEAELSSDQIPSPQPSTRPSGERASASNPGQTLALTENFRSAEGLIRFINPVFRALMHPALGGLSYDPTAELQFGAPVARAQLSATTDASPRVELHIITKDEDTPIVPEESDETSASATEPPDLQTAEREARLIALRLRALKEARHQVWERATPAGGFRDVEYSDMVVLLRGIAGRAEIFAKAFHQTGVPLLAGRSGFLAALEVADLLNLLRLLDNPLQDLPLLAVLRSPFVGLSADELAQIRTAERNGLLWTALQQVTAAEAKISAALRTKLTRFLEQYHHWRELIRHASLTYCLETALIATHYEALLRAGERGAERVANVRRLIEMARRFDPFQREGLYRFLQFIGAQEEAEVEHAPAAATHENAVRLMTIHASKGLEFPVVVLAGIGGRFNLRDLNADILLDHELGLAPKIFPPHARSKYPSLAHWSAGQRERRALLGEELRLLYVALTRARDTLLLVGTATKKQEIERWQNPSAINHHALLKANSCLDWVRLWFNSENQNNLWEADGGSGANQLLRWKFWPPGAACFALTPSQNEPVSLPPAADVPLHDIRAVIGFDYEYEAAVVEPAKTSVTALRRRISDETDTEARPAFRLPHSISLAAAADQKLTAAEIGTAHHAFLQFVALPEASTEVSLRNEAQRLLTTGALTADQAAALDFGALTAFWQSELGTKLRSQPEKFVNREMPFTTKFRVAEVEGLLQPDAPIARFARLGDDFVIVQGIADLAVILPEEIWLVDFKTDHIALAELPQRLQHYEPQMNFYALALSRIFDRPVTQCWLHFLSLHRSVAVGSTPAQTDTQRPPPPPASKKPAPPNGQLVFDWLPR